MSTRDRNNGANYEEPYGDEADDRRDEWMDHFSEEKLDEEIRDLMFRAFLSDEERKKVDLNDPDAVADAMILAARRQAAGDFFANIPADQLPDVQPNLKNLPYVSAKSETPPPEAQRGGMSPIERGARRCEHIKADNYQCGAPAMHRRRYCYFHDESSNGRNRKKALRVPVLEDRRAIQMAVTKVCQGIADERLDPKRATSLLYGLQVAFNAVASPARKRR